MDKLQCFGPSNPKTLQRSLRVPMPWVLGLDFGGLTAFHPQNQQKTEKTRAYTTRPPSHTTLNLRLLKPQPVPVPNPYNTPIDRFEPGTLSNNPLLESSPCLLKKPMGSQRYEDATIPYIRNVRSAFKRSLKAVRRYLAASIIQVRRLAAKEHLSQPTALKH